MPTVSWSPLCALQRTARQRTVVFSPIPLRNFMKPVEAELSSRLFSNAIATGQNDEKLSEGEWQTEIYIGRWMVQLHLSLKES